MRKEIDQKIPGALNNIPTRAEANDPLSERKLSRFEEKVKELTMAGNFESLRKGVFRAIEGNILPTKKIVEIIERNMGLSENEEFKSRVKTLALELRKEVVEEYAKRMLGFTAEGDAGGLRSIIESYKENMVFELKKSGALTEFIGCLLECYDICEDRECLEVLRNEISEQSTKLKEITAKEKEAKGITFLLKLSSKGLANISEVVSIVRNTSIPLKEEYLFARKLEELITYYKLLERTRSWVDQTIEAPFEEVAQRADSQTIKEEFIRYGKELPKRFVKITRENYVKEVIDIYTRTLTSLESLDSVSVRELIEHLSKSKLRLHIYALILDAITSEINRRIFLKKIKNKGPLYSSASKIMAHIYGKYVHSLGEKFDVLVCRPTLGEAEVRLGPYLDEATLKKIKKASSTL